MASPTNGGDVAERMRHRRRIQAVVRAWGKTTNTPNEDGLHRLARMAFEAALAYVDGELDTARGQAYAYVQECNRMDRELIKVREENADWKKSYNRIRSAASRAEDRAKESETKWENAKRDLEVARAALAEAQRPRKHDIEDGTK